MGMSAASAATFSMVPSKRLTTAAAMKAVTRLMPSHTRRRRVDGNDAGEHVFLVARGRPRDMTSCAASSRMTSTTSSTVMRPSSLPCCVDHGGGHQVAILEQLRHVVGGGFGRNARRLRVEDVADGFSGSSVSSRVSATVPR